MIVPITANPLPEVIPQSDLSISFEAIAQIPNSGFNNQAPRLNFIQSPRDGSGRLFVNDMRGKLYVIDGGNVSEFFDLRALVGPDFLAIGGQRGFISFVFDPDFKNNDIFYTVHSESKGSKIPDFSVTKPITNRLGNIIASSHHDVLTQWLVQDPRANSFNGTRREILRIEQPYADHNLGEIAFNPNALPGSADYGLLYIATADGGSDGFPVSNTDPLDNGQDLSVPLGKILRIDPKGNNSANGKYGIPLDNPFEKDNDPNTLGEIWAYGLRNPHRFSWDIGGEGKLLIVDIGQSFIEEVNLGIAGANYGWGNREGTFLINENNQFELFPLPEDDGLNHYTYPVAQYDHDVPTNVAIAGGFVYRGSAIPELNGQYIFADFATDGRFFTVDVDNLINGQQAPLAELKIFNQGEQTNFLNILGKTRSDLRFGTDEAGEIYVINKQDGVIRKMINTFTLTGDRWLQHVEEDLNPWWTQASAYGEPIGNFPTARSNDGSPIDPNNVSLDYQNAPSWQKVGIDRNYTVAQSRQTFSYGVAYHLTGDSQYLDLAKAGVDWLRENLLDDVNGGAYQYLNRSDFQPDNNFNGRSSQEQAYALQGLTFYYYLTRDGEVLADILNLKNHIFDTYFDEQKNIFMKFPSTANNEIKSLTDNLDQINAYLHLLALAAPQEYQENFNNDLINIANIVIDQFYSPTYNIFWNRIDTPSQQILKGSSTDYGISAKAFWYIYMIGELTGDQILIDFAQNNGARLLQESYQNDSGTWALRPFLDASGKLQQNLDKVWWIYAEQDQFAGTLGLNNPVFMTQYLQNTASWWFENMVDKEYGGIYHTLNASTLLPTNDVKQHLWKNGFHEYEHALVGYLTTQGYLDESATLYFVRQDGQESEALFPYYFDADIDQINVNPIADANWNQVAVTFSDIRNVRGIDDIFYGIYFSETFDGKGGFDQVVYRDLNLKITLTATNQVIKQGTSWRNRGTWVDQLVSIEQVEGNPSQINTIDASDAGDRRIEVDLSANQFSLLGAGLPTQNFTVINFRDVVGTDQDDVIKGNALNNRLVGGKGNDILDGGLGNDTMIGGEGDDTYYVNVSWEKVIELKNEGIDTVRSVVSYTLPDHLENLELLGSNNIRGIGNSLNNIIIGNGGNNLLDGGAGQDILIGGLGNDTLNLGLDDGVTDIVQYTAGDGRDVINHFVKGIDQLAFIDIPFIDVATANGNTLLRLGNGIQGDAGFGRGQILATLRGVTGFTEVHLGPGGASLAASNMAQFFFA